MIQTSSGLKLGKKPARPGAMKLRLLDYVDPAKLPPVPANFGHDKLVSNWGMLANDKYGCCVWSGAAHETMLWNKMAGKDVAFSDDSVLSDYSTVTGFSEFIADSDQGTDMVAAAQYRQKTGVLDAAGNRHKVAGFLSLDIGDLNQVWAASFLFASVGVGINFPESADQQFNAGLAWDYIPGSKVVGGHYFPINGRKNGVLYGVTWGRLQAISTSFLQNYVDEGIAYISDEMLTNGKSVLGFDQTALLADLNSLKSA